MSKNKHFTGQPIYNQLLSVIDKDEVRRFSRQGDHDRYVKKLDGLSHLQILLYGVLMQHESLREIVVGMLSEAHKLEHIGMRYMVKRSTLSEANNRRSSDFFAQVYFSLYRQYKDVLADSRIDKAWEYLLHIMDYAYRKLALKRSKEEHQAQMELLKSCHNDSTDTDVVYKSLQLPRRP